MSEATRTIQAHPGGVLRATGLPALRLAWSLWALCVALVASSLVLALLTPDFLSPKVRPAPSLTFVFGLLSVVSATLGAYLASRFPRNPVGWVFCCMGLLYGLRRFATAYADYALLARPSLPLGEQAVWLSTWPRLWVLIPCGLVLTMLFPTGRLPSRSWRLVVWMGICGASLLAFGDAFRAGPMLFYVDNPFGVTGNVGGFVPAYWVFESSSVAGGAMLSAACLAALGVLTLRLVRGAGEERKPLVWLAGAAVPALAGSAIVLLDWTVERFALLFLGQAAWPGLWIIRNLASAVGVDMAEGRIAEVKSDVILETLATLALLSIPLCSIVAILRHRLYGTDFTLNRLLVAPWVQGSRLRWPRVLVASMVTGALPFAFVYLGVYVYVLAYPAFGDVPMDSGEQLGDVAAFVSGWGARVFFLMATVLVAWWVARGVREGIVFHGVLVGLVGATANQTIVWFFVPPVTLAELYVYLVFGTVGGALGGVLGRTSLTGEVYRASRQIGEARNPAAVAAALGENLAGPDVHGVSLWRRVDRETASIGPAAGINPAQDLVLWGSWGSGEISGHPSARLGGGLASVLTRLDGRSSAAVRLSELPASDRAVWEREGIRSALLVPLVAPGETWRGLLMMTFRSKRRFSRNELRAYLTISVQAALVLENLRLVDEARSAGRQTGVLVERQRMAGEIHDTLAQGFASVIVSLSAAEMAQDSSRSHAEWSRHLEAARRTARDSLTEARRLVWALQPEALDRRSLPEALELLVREWSGDTGIEARAATSGTVCPLRPATEVALLRAAQEGLTNIRKHARAESVAITLSYIGDRIVLDVLDDGVGFDAARLKTVIGAQDTGGFGLRAMRERIEQLGGTLLVESAPGEGTTIVVELPISPDDPEAEGSGSRATEEVHDA